MSIYILLTTYKPITVYINIEWPLIQDFERMKSEDCLWIGYQLLRPKNSGKFELIFLVITVLIVLTGFGAFFSILYKPFYSLLPFFSKSFPRFTLANIIITAERLSFQFGHDPKIHSFWTSFELKDLVCFAILLVTMTISIVKLPYIVNTFLIIIIIQLFAQRYNSTILLTLLPYLC